MAYLRDGVFSISHSHWILHYHYTFFNQALPSVFGLDRFFSSPNVLVARAIFYFGAILSVAVG